MPTQQVAWYKGKILLGATVIPCYPGAEFMAPLNEVLPPIIGNYWAVNYGDGFTQPIVELSFPVRDKAAEVLGSTFLNYWLSRTSDVAHDTTAIASGLTFWDGYKGWVLAGAKADSFTIGTSKGEPIRFTGRFCGTIFSAQVTDPAPAFVGWSTEKLLQYNAVSFDTNLNNRVWRVDLSYSNNHSPDMSLDGTTGPAACNAGQMSAGFQITCQAQDDVAIPGGGTIAQETPMYFEITGSGAPAKKVRFTLTRPRNQNPNDGKNSPPRVMRQYGFNCLSTDGQTTPVLVVSTPGGAGTF